MTFDIYCITYNEPWLLPKMVEWYREKLKGHDITFNIFDNESTDDTAQIARDLGCIVYSFSTGSEIRDDIYRDMFNSMWKASYADYVIQVCTDEFIDIDPNQLKGCTIAQCTGYNMVGNGTVELEQIVEGVRAGDMDKCLIFSPLKITEMNYGPGAHQCVPRGLLIWCRDSPKLYHMNMISKEWMVFRYKRGRERLSAVNKREGWGMHYDENDQAVEQLWEHAWGLREQVRTI